MKRGNRSTLLSPRNSRGFLPALLCMLVAGGVGAVSSDMILIAAGTFIMGGAGGDPDELPAHEVTLNSFSIDKREVTRAAYDSCVQRGKCTPAHYDDSTCMAWLPPRFRRVQVESSKQKPDFPVVCVSWDQARSFCASKGKRLPTEAEWEYSAGGGRAMQRYAWGDQPPSPQNCAFALGGSPVAVGTFAPNDLGLFDMTGNVWEWTADWYQVDRYQEAQASAEITSQGPAIGYYRAIRGGGWYSTSGQLRVKNRHWFAPAFSEVSIGFRCAR